MSVRHSPTVRRRRLGAELRRLRETAGLTCEQVGEHLDCSASKISRIETARVPARTVDVQALCRLYHASEEQAATLLALVKESKQTGWWHRFDDALPDWFETYVGLEAAAASIRTYEIQLVPGLLQTEAYARALFESGDLGQRTDIEHAVSIRRARQEVLAGDNPPQYWAILSEAALLRTVGGAGVLRDQLLHLVEVSQLPHVTIQVIRNDLGAHPGMLTPFVILGFPERADPRVVFVDYLTGALYLEKPEEVDRYDLAFNHLVAAAVAPSQTVELIAELAKKLH
ncbi:MAG TPA: helix-turn-helix transcriptional regulator [Rugosimonospora sp.]|nr:helix-turn-helix transcriptional regulator [Rugosimonospora sp.]